VNAMPLGLVALIGIGAAVVASLFTPLAIRAAQALWDRINRGRTGAASSEDENVLEPAGHHR
jgi:hypothetical protein